MTLEEAKNQEQAGDPEHPEIVIDEKRYRAPEPVMTGAQLRLPAEPHIGDDRDLWEEVRGGEDRLIGNDERVHLKDGDVFFSTPKHINPMTDTMAPGRELLAVRDIEYLESKKLNYRATAEGGFVCVEILAYELPQGLQPERCDLLVRLPRGFPDQAPDMF